LVAGSAAFCARRRDSSNSGANPLGSTRLISPMQPSKLPRYFWYSARSLSTWAGVKPPSVVPASSSATGRGGTAGGFPPPLWGGETLSPICLGDDGPTSISALERDAALKC